MTDVVNIGAADNDDAGDPLRAAFNKINIEFASLGITLQHIPLANLPVASFIGLNDPHALMAVGYSPDAAQKVVTKGYADTAIAAAAADLQPTNEKGVASGYTPLDAANHVPVIHLPSALAIPRKVFDNVADMLLGTVGIHAGDGLLVTDDPVDARNGEYVARVNHPTIMAQLWFLGDRVPVHRHGAPDIDTFLAGRVMTLDVAMRELLVTSGTVMMDDGYEPVMNQAIATKNYVDSVSGSIPAWADSTYHTHALVSAHGCIYMATAAIAVGDEAPGTSGASPWQRLAGLRSTEGALTDMPANPVQGDRHYFSGATEQYPRWVVRNATEWAENVVAVQVKEEARQISGDFPSIALQTGTTDDPKGILWIKSAQVGNNDWHQVNKLWGTAWGNAGGGPVSAGNMSDNGSIHGRTHFKAVKGRRYKFNVCIPIATGPKGDKTRWYARFNVNGGWVTHGVDGGFWEEGHGEATSTCFGHCSMQPIYDSVVNMASMDVSLYFHSTTSDTQILDGYVSIEDIGPTTP